MPVALAQTELFAQFAAVYGGRRVLLTGHTGFKGSYLLYWLHQMGAQVCGYALPALPGSVYERLDGAKLCAQEHLHDLRDRAYLAQVVQAFKPDFVFHLAAQPLVLTGYQDPIFTYETNVMGTAYLLEALRGVEQPCVVVAITTDKVYHNREWVYPYRETDALGGYDPYSASKAGAEIVISSYRDSFFHPAQYAEHRKAVASARAGNVIGGGDVADYRLIPDTARALTAGQPLRLRNPHAVRPWQHVLDPLYGYLLLGVKLLQDPAQYAGAYNFGPAQEDTLTVAELARIAVAAYGGGQIIEEPVANAPHEAGLLKLDTSLAHSKLGWKPRWNASQALHHTMSFYKDVWAEGKPAAQVLQAQLAAYCQ